MGCPPLPSGEVGETPCVEPGEGFNLIDSVRTLTRLAFGAATSPRRGEVNTADAARVPR
jgi:hypothetical protein